MRDYERSSQLGVARYSEPQKLVFKLLSHFKFGNHFDKQITEQQFEFVISSFDQNSDYYYFLFTIHIFIIKINFNGNDSNLEQANLNKDPNL